MTTFEKAVLKANGEMTDCQATGVERLGGENASVRDLPPWSGHIEPAWNTNVVYHVYFFFKSLMGRKYKIAELKNS